MKKLLLSLAIVGLVLAAATNSWALITPSDSLEPVQVYHAVNQVFVNAGLANPNYANNSAVDVLQITPDEYWQNLAGQAGGQLAAVSIGAGWQSQLGTYLQGAPGAISYVLPPVGYGQGYLGDGSSANPYLGGILPGVDSEQYFGFATEVTDSGNPSVPLYHWFSDPSLNNAGTLDGLDRMLTYQLSGLAGTTIYLDTGDAEPAPFLLTENTYLLAWEDFSDGDYNDATFLVAKVRPIPEPMSMMLLGSGLVGLFGLRRKVN